MAAQGLGRAPASAAEQAAATLQASLDERAPSAALHEQCAIAEKWLALACAAGLTDEKDVAAMPDKALPGHRRMCLLSVGHALRMLR